MKGVSGDEVISGLWRDGYVPQWIDIAVVGETGAATVIDVIACGRFIDDEQRLYYASTDVAPFGVKGPALPAGYVQGQRFSIHERSSCWSLEDLERAGRHAAKVWSLELHGPAFDDNALATMPTFSRLDILELTWFALKGSLVAMPSALRRLTIHAADASDDDVRRILSGCPMSLESLGLRGTPVSDRVLEDLERFPVLEYVDAADTRMTKAALERFAERHPTSSARRLYGQSLSPRSRRETAASSTPMSRPS